MVLIKPDVTDSAKNGGIAKEKTRKPDMYIYLNVLFPKCRCMSDHVTHKKIRTYV